jgi:CheY-like chemotaxis protein
MSTSPPQVLRILCLEDNPLIAFHVEQMIEDLGHLPVATVDSFAELQALPEVEADCALIDIDLADGCTGPDAAQWLRQRGIPGIFVTGQKEIAEANAELVIGHLVKPITIEGLKRVLDQIIAKPRSETR